MPDSQGYVARYNSLIDVLAADGKLDAMGRGSVLDGLCAVILDHGLEDTYGIRLLHTHHPIQPGEWMVEEEERLADGGAALTTRAMSTARCGTRAVANSWMLVDGEWLAVEYSTDADVLATDPIEAHPAFAAAFARAVTAAGVAAILGLCAARRRFFTTHGDGAHDRGHGLLETTDAARRANVLRFEDMASRPAETLIQTVWLATDGTEAECPVGGFHCKILIRCEKDSYGDHTGKKIVDHEREPLPSH